VGVIVAADPEPSVVRLHPYGGLPPDAVKTWLPPAVTVAVAGEIVSAAA